MHLSIAEYPAFKRYYLKHKYYSVVRPQMEFSIKKEGRDIIGTGKFLWRTIEVNKKPVRLFAFGVLIAKQYQKQGLGSELVRRSIVEAKKRGADLLYGSTSNPIMAKVLRRLGFKRLHTAVLYKNGETKKVERESAKAYTFEFKRGLIREIESHGKLFIGRGPL